MVYKLANPVAAAEIDRQKALKVAAEATDKLDQTLKAQRPLPINTAAAEGHKPTFVTAEQLEPLPDDKIREEGEKRGYRLHPQLSPANLRIRFLRVNADNTVSALTAADFLTATGAYAASNPSGYTSNPGTVTSVALSLPAIFTVSGSPVTTNGTLSATLASQSANLVFASPNGSAGAPTFRTLVSADLPPAIQSVTSAATVTPTFANDQVNITAQAAALALANPTGTAVDGHGISIRIKGNGTPRAITYGTQYRAIGVTLPTTTVASKTLYLGMVYNAADVKWDVVAVAQEA